MAESYRLPTEFNPASSTDVHALGTDQFVGHYIDVTRPFLGDDGHEILYALIGDEEVDPEGLARRLENNDPTLLVTTADHEHYRIAKKELVRRAVAYLGMTKKEVFGEE